MIIPCFNAAATLGTQLEALARQRWQHPWEVIVADNGSTDDSLAIAEQYRDRLPGFRIVDASARRGSAHARNVAVKTARGKTVAFCDADDEVAPGWVAAIGTALSFNDFVASRHEFTKLNPPAVYRTRKNAQDRGLQRYTHPPFLPHAGGCGLGITRAVHETIGGFDETMLRLMDTDYCWRAQLAGVTLYFAGDAVIHVRFRETPRGILGQAFLFGEYNVRLYKKYRPLGMPRLPLRAGMWAWWGLLVGVPKIWNPETRLRWMRSVAWRLGRAKGCLKYRVLAP